MLSLRVLRWEWPTAPGSTASLAKPWIVRACASSSSSVLLHPRHTCAMLYARLSLDSCRIDQCYILGSNYCIVRISHSYVLISLLFLSYSRSPGSIWWPMTMSVHALHALLPWIEFSPSFFMGGTFFVYIYLYFFTFKGRKGGLTHIFINYWLKDRKSST